MARRNVLPHFALIGTLALLSVMSTGCETQADYGLCDLDEEVTKKGVCTGSDKGNNGTTSCVVTKHPHCAHSICLSYFSTQSVCSKTCANDSECGAGTCWPFSDTESYCVPDTAKEQLGG
ncbi:MAG: hypothetical protein KC502_03045 [Myxococcales bacterium]|nr:hypothetical protein [Myxococcales bacterium]